MLKVLDCKDKKAASVEFNTYIPLYVEFGSWDISKEPTVYWRNGDFIKSLVEIEIGRNEGDIRSITLNLCEEVNIIEDLEIKNKKICEGIPVINLEKFFNATCVDEKGNLRVFIYKDIVNILFSENEIVSIIQNENIGFGLDVNNAICSILVKGLKENEKAMFLQH